MKQNLTQSVGVIGSGLGGLAAACTLAARGYQVTLFERNQWLGGKAAQLEDGGFRFDMGPTIVTLPSVLRRIFAEAGRHLEDYLEMVRLDPQWRCFFHDGSVLNLRQNPNVMAKELNGFAPGTNSGDRYLDFMRLSERLNDISQRYFFDKPIGGLRDMFDFKSSFDPHVLGDVLAMRLGRSVAGTVRSFTPDPRVAQMMDHFTQYVGSSPYGSPAVLCGIAHMQADEGIWYPIGGTRAVPAALARLACELGVSLRTGTQIVSIRRSDGRVTGVLTDRGEYVPLAALVSNCDSVRTHRELLGSAERAAFERRRRYEPACSGVVLYLGLRKRYEHLAHHDFVFSRDPHEEFDWIYHRGEPAPDPTCYLAATTCSEPATAPPGGEALYVLVHTPYLRPHHDWKSMLPAYRRTIIDKLKTTGQMPDLEERIVFERALTPQDIDERYQVLNGAIYGLASHGKFVGAFKPGNRSPDLRGLYLAGGAAHPGPGMPMVLMSGWIAADTLDQDGMAERGERLMTARASKGADLVAA
ncbi:MAG TPA: phytoene desaturase family protein [Verrucomicrobiota bacterium]|nr:phytoene desaturase family protein [Verrucomicrobiota bacterium]